MALTRERLAHVLLAAVCAAVVIATAATSLPRASGGQFWGDGATYYAMAWSLAEDGDVQFDARDLARARREFPAGPQGVFLKRTDGGYGTGPTDADGRRMYFAKALLYPLVAAPLVKLFGTRGLLITNGLCLAGALALGYVVLRRRQTPLAALVAAVALFLFTVAPLYAFWPAPETLMMFLGAAGLAAWITGHPWLAAVLFGLDTYAKPYNLWLALPLGAEPFLTAWAQGPTDRVRALARGLGQSVLRGLVLVGVVVACFGLNVALTGEANYQGGERKTFYGSFPGDRRDDGKEVTFGNSGIWMTTNRPGPAIEEQTTVLNKGEVARAPHEIHVSWLRNLGYFWVGRFGGALPYFPAAVLALVAFLVLGPRDREGWLAVAALGVSWLFYLHMIPDNWYGGGGTIGNRYFLNLLPLALFLVPRGRAWPLAVPAILWGALALGPLLLAPVAHALRPGDHTMRLPFRLFPPELTMLNDLSAFTEGWRKKQPVGDTEGDAHRHWPADPKAYYLYFLGEGTHGLEVVDGRTGFRACAPTEVVLRALEPVRTMTIAASGPAAVRVGGHDVQATPAGVDTAPGDGFPYYDTLLYRVRVTPGPGCPFVTIALAVDKRPR